MPARGRLSPRRTAAAVAEVIGAVVVATGAVALLDLVATTNGLAVVYLLAVLAVAIRRGGTAALAAAVLSVLAFNFFFIAPVHRLTIADSENVAALVVFLVAALVVGRLAAAARERAAEAEERAAQAARREGEAETLASVAALLLRGSRPDAELGAIAERLGRALGLPVRLERTAAPSPTDDERAVSVPVRQGSLWAYLPREGAPDPDALARVLPAPAPARRRRVSSRPPAGGSGWPSAPPRARRRSAPTSPRPRSSTRSRTTS